MANNKAICIRIPEKIYKNVVEMSSELGISHNAFVNLALNNYIKNSERIKIIKGEQ